MLKWLFEVKGLDSENYERKLRHRHHRNASSSGEALAKRSFM